MLNLISIYIYSWHFRKFIFTDFLFLDWDNSSFWTLKQFQTKPEKMGPVFRGHQL